jgi:hypothetical protein
MQTIITLLLLTLLQLVVFLVVILVSLGPLPSRHRALGTRSASIDGPRQFMRLIQHRSLLRRLSFASLRAPRGENKDTLRTQEALRVTWRMCSMCVPREAEVRFTRKTSS